jgi:hypothetical protein
VSCQVPKVEPSSVSWRKGFSLSAMGWENRTWWRLVKTLKYNPKLGSAVYISQFLPQRCNNNGNGWECPNIKKLQFDLRSNRQLGSRERLTEANATRSPYKISNVDLSSRAAITPVSFISPGRTWIECVCATERMRNILYTSICPTSIRFTTVYEFFRLCELCGDFAWCINGETEVVDWGLNLNDDDAAWFGTDQVF